MRLVVHLYFFNKIDPYMSVVCRFSDTWLMKTQVSCTCWHRDYRTSRTAQYSQVSPRKYPVTTHDHRQPSPYRFSSSKPCGVSLLTYEQMLQIMTHHMLSTITIYVLISHNNRKHNFPVLTTRQHFLCHNCQGAKYHALTEIRKATDW